MSKNIKKCPKCYSKRFDDRLHKDKISFECGTLFLEDGEIYRRSIDCYEKQIALLERKVEELKIENQSLIEDIAGEDY